VNLADSWRSRAVSPEEKSSYLTAATSSRISPVFILAALYLRLPSQRRCELLLLFYPLRIFCTACRALLSKILSVVMIRSSSGMTSLLLHENHNVYITWFGHWFVYSIRLHGRAPKILRLCDKFAKSLSQTRLRIPESWK